MKRLLLIFYIFILATLFFTQQTFAQCAMCKAVVETNLENDVNAVGAGLNSGILYLMAFPYLVLIIGGYFWYRSQKLQRIA